MSVREKPAPAGVSELLPNTRRLEVIYRPIAEIHPYGANARDHFGSQIPKLMRSIRANGVVQPLLTDEAGVLIAGHAVFLAAKKLGFTELPTIMLQGLSDTEKRKLRIALNKLGDLSRFSPEGLKNEILAIIESDPSFDPEEIGFEIPEIELILKSDPDIGDDDLPAHKPEARAQLGDVWALGDHVIGCGDTRDPDFLGRVMGQVLADAAFLDIPYNVSINRHATRSGQHGEFAMASGEMSDDEFIEFTSVSLTRAREVTRDGGVHFVCIDHHHIDQLMVAARPVYGGRIHICVWNKSNAGMGSLYRSKHEFIAVYRVGDAQPLNNVQLGRYGRSRTSVWDYPSVNTVGTARSKELKWHPTVKPVALVADAIKDVTRPGDIVLDTFLGSGTTLIAAERTGRRCRGIEIEPTYVDLAIERWVAITGGEPVLLHRAAPAEAAEGSNAAPGWGSRDA